MSSSPALRASHSSNKVREIEVAGDQVGKLIGVRGGNISQLRQATSCGISIPKERSPTVTVTVWCSLRFCDEDKADALRQDCANLIQMMCDEGLSLEAGLQRLKVQRKAQEQIEEDKAKVDEQMNEVKKFRLVFSEFAGDDVLHVGLLVSPNWDHDLMLGMLSSGVRAPRKTTSDSDLKKTYQQVRTESQRAETVEDDVGIASLVQKRDEIAPSYAPSWLEKRWAQRHEQATRSAPKPAECPRLPTPQSVDDEPEKPHALSIRNRKLTRHEEILKSNKYSKLAPSSQNLQLSRQQRRR